jgi:hypothetical protein
MRTKTMLLSALLGTLGSVSLMAQSSTNVYSLNVVGYVNVTIEPGYNIVSCPLMSSPDNTLNTLFPNSSGAYKGWKVYFFTGGTYSQIEVGTKSGWQDGGTNTINPGQAVFVLNSGTANVTNTFVGTVPSGTLTNTMAPGFNLVGSILPASGDLVTNGLTLFTNTVKGDRVYVNDPVAGYSAPGGIYTATKSGFTPSNPTIPNVGEGFFYENNNGTTPLNWVESFSVSNP